MSTETSNELFTDIPLANIPYVSMKAPNEHLNIYNGKFTIRLGKLDYVCDGRIFYKWFPFCSIGFEGIILDNFDKLQSIFEKVDVKLLVNNIDIGNGRILTTNSPGSLITGSSSRISIREPEASLVVDEIVFPLVNFREYTGKPIREQNERGGRNGRLEIKDGQYEITLDKRKDYDLVKKLLRAEGGYIDTYIGKLRGNQQELTIENTIDVRECLEQLIYFTNSQRTGIPILLGIHNGQICWREYKSIVGIDSKYFPSWSEVNFLDCNAMWTKMRNYWRAPDSKDALETAIYWYNQANCNTSLLEGSIVLAQAALELLFNWLIVEQLGIVKTNVARKMDAATKIRELLKIINVNAAVPNNFKDLQLLNKTDGPESIIAVRNALVHGSESKRKQLRNVSDISKDQALQLGIGYIELLLLYIFDYQGKYRNRANYEVNTVPWAASMQ